MVKKFSLRISLHESFIQVCQKWYTSFFILIYERIRGHRVQNLSNIVFKSGWWEREELMLEKGTVHDVHLLIEKGLRKNLKRGVWK